MNLVQAIAALVLVSGFAGVSWLIVHARTDTIYKPVSFAVFLVSLPVVWYSMSFTVGTPRPSEAYRFPSREVKVLGWYAVPGKRIYLMVEYGSNPLYYSIPWSRDAAEKLQSASEGDSDVMIKGKSGKEGIPGFFDFGWWFDVPEPQVYVAPSQRKMPEKSPVDNAQGMVLE